MLLSATLTDTYQQSKHRLHEATHLQLDSGLILLLWIFVCGFFKATAYEQNYQTRELIIAESRPTNGATKTRVAYGKSHLACE